MKIEIKTQNNTIPEELLKPIICIPPLREEKHNGHTYVYYGKLVGECFGNLNCKKTITRYCEACGCELYATWPNPGIKFYTDYHYDKPISSSDYTWKTRVDAVLTPYFERNKIQEEFDEKVNKEENEIAKRPCPVCGNQLSLWKNEKAETYEAYKKSESYITLCDVPVTVKVNEEIISSVKTDKEKLKEYFLQVINIEKNIRLLKQRLFVLYALSYDINRDAKFAQLYPIMAERQQVSEAIEQMRTEFKRKSTEITELINIRKQLSEEKIALPMVDFPVKPIEPTKPTYAIPNIFNKKKVAAENEALTEKYNNDVVLYNKALSEYPILLEQAKQHQAELHRKALIEREKEICELDEKISKMISELDVYKAEIEAKETDFENRINQLKNNTEYPSVQLKISLDKEIETAEELLKDLFKKKHQLYSTDIIFGKYRDIAAVTSFYEYLISGRCETLEGVNGCYNLYESELRANIIINKLDAIGDSLETIKGNQYMLYSQLSEINHELSSLNATTTAMLNGIKDTTEIFLEHSSVIAYNSAVSAYYSKLNAEIASSDRYISMICW